MDETGWALARAREADLVRRARRRDLVREASAGRTRLASAGGARPAAAGGNPHALPRTLRLVVAGVFVNYLGYGAVLPFEVIYLREARGFSLAVAGVVVSLVTAVAVAAAPVAGPLLDRYGARAVAVVGAIALATGYGGLAVATSPGWAAAAAAVAGAGNGALNPAQTTLIAALTPAVLRHRAVAVSRVAANVGAGIGGGVGGLVAATGTTGLAALFLVNAATYLAYVALLVGVVRDAVRPAPVAGGYRTVLRDRGFVSLALVNVGMIAVGWGVFTWLVPPYAAHGLGIDARHVGLLLLANATAVALAQVPVARYAEGRRRMRMVALAAMMFVAGCLLVTSGSVVAVSARYPALLAAVVLVGLGECFHTAVLTPLVADLAPEGLRGRYVAGMGLSWWVGLALAPLVGAPVLAVGPAPAFLAAAMVALACGVGALRMERRLPTPTRRTPRPDQAPATSPG